MGNKFKVGMLGALIVTSLVLAGCGGAGENSASGSASGTAAGATGNSSSSAAGSAAASTTQVAPSSTESANKPKPTLGGEVSDADASGSAGAAQAGGVAVPSGSFNKVVTGDYWDNRWGLLSFSVDFGGKTHRCQGWQKVLTCVATAPASRRRSMA